MAEGEFVEMMRMISDLSSALASYKFKYFEAMKELKELRIMVEGLRAENRMLKEEIAYLRGKLNGEGI